MFGAFAFALAHTRFTRDSRRANCGRDRDRVITRELPSWTVRKVGYITKLSTLDRAARALCP